MDSKTPQVGAQDPELRNSPIVWESDDQAEEVGELASDDPVCFFNGHAYPAGSMVKSGTALLRCEDGLWVPTGPADPTNP